MKFKIREGFVCTIAAEVQTAPGRFERQESLAYAGQVLDLPADQALEHAHRLEPVDDEAAAWLQTLHQPEPVAQADVIAPAHVAQLAQRLAELLLSGGAMAAKPSKAG